MTKKEAAVCPSCGEWNWKPSTYVKQKVLDEHGIEHYITFSFTKYKCTCCKTVWSERWDYDENGI